MVIYSKTAWKDHVVDGNGNVLQQGTPMSAANLLKLEEGLANATASMAPELGAATAHSGILAIEPFNFSSGTTIYKDGIQYAVGSSLSNILRMAGFKALITGAVLDIMGSVNINVNGWFTRGFEVVLAAPPTEGSHDDLVFLEAWRDQTTQAWQTRLRYSAGVDFVKYPSDGFCIDTAALNITTNTHNMSILGQGGNTEPVVSALINYAFRNAKQRAANGNTFALANDDVGLYVSGTGSDTSKSVLKTYDGYVYAIPLFKIKRRNSGGYSANNPNGARIMQEVKAISSTPNLALGETRQITFVLPTGVTALSEIFKAGETVRRSDNVANAHQIVSIDSATTMTIKNLGNGAVSFNTYGLCPFSDRPDGLFSNIIDARDITDLRHKTYLTAPAYEQLLIDGADQILRGASQVERKTALRKTYVGVRKTPIDANHIFYASMDGTVTAEVGTLSTVAMGQNGSGYQPMPTGAGYRTPSASAGQYTDLIPTEALGTTFTVEGFLDLNQAPSVSAQARTIFEIRDANNLGLLRLMCLPSSFDSFMLQTTSLISAYGTTYTITVPAANRIAKRAHIRLTYNNGTVNIYVDGSLLYTVAWTLIRPAVKVGLTRSVIGLAGEAGLEGYTGSYMNYSDVSISKTNRGAVFATLPADVIQGYADITPALNYQRRINSDAQTSQKTYAAAKVKNVTQEPGITVTKGTGTNTAAWEAGDKIKLRGLAGEIVGGIIDTDTALARVLSINAAANVLTLDDVSKIAVNDTIIVSVITDLKDGWGTRTVSAVDTTNKTITLTTALGASAVTSPIPLIIYETTASTSSPVVRAIISGTSTTVPGTWTALGTNEAEVTLGTLPGGLAAQDIIIEYSLNMAAGQGGLYQVYTKTLGGEANGKKLIPAIVAVTDDFVGKITGSSTANPHKAYSSAGSALVTPAAPGTEFTQADYNAINSLDNSLKVTTTSVSGQQAQVLIIVDVVRAFEDKYGKIPGAYTTLEKVNWLKANLGRINFLPYLYGVSPSGFKASMARRTTGGAWSSSDLTNMNHTASTITVLASGSGVSDIQSTLLSDGTFCVVLFAEASDGVTASTLYLDHVALTFEAVAKTGYDTLAPENPRRDAGLAGVLYVRRQTREVESLFLGNDEDNGIVVIGDYLPTQEMASATLTGATDILLSHQEFVTVAGTNKAYGENNSYANAITRLLGPGSDVNYKVDPQSLLSKVTYDGTNVSGVLRYFYADAPHGGNGAAASLYADGIPAWCQLVSEFLVGQPALVLYNGELLLRIFLRTRSQSATIGIGGSGISYYFRLPGRPLVKL